MNLGLSLFVPASEMIAAERVRNMENADDLDAAMRAVAFEHVRALSRVYEHLSSEHLSAGFEFRGERVPLINPRRGIFKPRQMRHLLSIKTVFPVPGRRIWYDDQTEVHRQIFESYETID